MKRPKNRFRPNRKAIAATARAMMTGKRISPNSAAPTSYSQRPYNNLTLKMFVQAKGSLATISTARVAETIALQVGLNPQTVPKVNFKLRELRSWAVAKATDDVPELRVNISSLDPLVSNDSGPVTANYPVLCQLADTGNLSQAAKVGYVYPVGMATKPVNADSQFTVFTVTSNTDDVVVHLTLAWSLTDEAPSPDFARFDISSESLESSI